MQSAALWCAVVGVVLYQVGRVAGGFCGVDIFFILSDCVIGPGSMVSCSKPAVSISKASSSTGGLDCWPHSLSCSDSSLLWARSWIPSVHWVRCAVPALRPPKGGWIAVILFCDLYRDLQLIRTIELTLEVHSGLLCLLYIR